MAKALGIGPNKLFARLREEKILMDGNRNKKNLPYQEYIDRGYFRVKETPIVMGDKTINRTQTLVTPKGVGSPARIEKEPAGSTAVKGSESIKRIILSYGTNDAAIAKLRELFSVIELALLLSVLEKGLQEEIKIAEEMDSDFLKDNVRQLKTLLETKWNLQVKELNLWKSLELSESLA